MNKKIVHKPKLSQEDRVSQPFLNKYFWKSDKESLYYPCIDTEVYNESILVLDGDGIYKQMPYIMEMNPDQLDVLTEYFGIHPIHQTNRISMLKKSHANKSEVSRFESLISEHIKPKIIITFSKSVGEGLKNLFKIHFEKQLEPMGFWSGIARIKNKYFYIYCLPITSELDIRSIEVNRYLMSSRVYEAQTCLHLNGIVKNDTTFSIPKRPIADQVMRENILRLPDFILIPSLPQKSTLAIANVIRDFDEYDLILAQHLNDYCPEIIAIKLSKSEYLELRNKESSQSLCHKYFNKTDLDYRLYVLNLALIRLYLYSHYPQESFDLDWKDTFYSNKFELDNYKDSLKAFNTFKETLCHASAK